MANGQRLQILILQFVRSDWSRARPEFRHDLGVAVALLKADGFDVALVPLSGYQPVRLRRALNEYRPTHVFVDIPPTRITAARHIIVDVAERRLLPVTVAGSYATCQPGQAISIPGATALVLGEYEESLLELYRSVRDGRAEAVAGPEETQFAARPELPGVWLNSEEGLIRNEPAPLAAEPDRLPFPDREIFDYQRIVRDSREAAFAATRGCDRWCSFCPNDCYMELYAGNAATLRRRSVGNLLEEVEAVVARYKGIRRVVFCDHAFVADADWLGRFAEQYPRRCRLPYRCHVRLSCADAGVAEMLARSGCEVAEVEIGSGSRFIREEILALPTSEGQILSGVAALKAQNLRVHGRVFVGAPYESEVSVGETLDLLARCRLDAVRPRVFFPVPGTRAAEMCAENGWIGGGGEGCFRANRSVLEMPSFPARRIDAIARRFESLLGRRRRRLRGRLAKLRRLGARRLHLFRRRPRAGGRR